MIIFLSEPEDYDSGERLAAVTWIQSMLQDQGKRTLLYELAQWASQITPDTPQSHQLNNVRANIVRMWPTAAALLLLPLRRCVISWSSIVDGATFGVERCWAGGYQ